MLDTSEPADASEIYTWKETQDIGIYLSLEFVWRCEESKQVKERTHEIGK